MFKVINNNPFDFVGRHNGIDYAFPMNAETPVYVEDDACTHIFGLSNSDKTTILARHGWSGVGKTYREGMAILNNFSFEHVQQRYDAPLAREILEPPPPPAVEEDHRSAPVIQDAPATNVGADESTESAGAVEETGGSKSRRGRATA